MNEKRAQGIFISRFQKSWQPQPWQSFVDIKCTDGLTKDPCYDGFLETARANGVIVGAVHYQRCDIPWEEQVDFFCENAKGADYLADDFEGSGNESSKDFALDALGFVTSAAHRSGKRTAFYSSPKYIQEWMYHHGVYWVRGYDDLWIAQWPFSRWNDLLLQVPISQAGWAPRLPAGCTKYCKWQYGAEYLGRGAEEGVGSRHVCLEVFNGTVDDLRKWAGCGQPGEPDVDEYGQGWDGGYRAGYVAAQRKAYTVIDNWIYEDNPVDPDWEVLP